MRTSASSDRSAAEIFCPTCPRCEQQVGQQKPASLLNLSHLSQVSHLFPIKEKKWRGRGGERGAAAARGINGRTLRSGEPGETLGQATRQAAHRLHLRCTIARSRHCRPTRRPCSPATTRNDQPRTT